MTYSFVVRNTGDVTLTNVTVNDADLTPAYDANLGTLAVGQSVTVSVAQAVNGTLINTVNVQGEDPNGDPVTGTDTLTVTEVHPGFLLTKTLVAPTNRPPIPGETLTFSISLANTGDAPFVAIPAIDMYDTNDLALVQALPEALAVGNAIIWTNAGPLAAGESTNLTVVFTALGPTTPDAHTNVVVAVPVMPTNYPPAVPASAWAAYQVDAPATISGGVFVDANGNGVKDSADTNGLAGVTVTLLDTNGTVVAAGVTDAGGNYAFTNLVPGAYAVVETDPTGYVSTGNRDGAGTNNAVSVTVTSGQASTGNDFLDALATPSVIGDLVFIDIDRDGVFIPTNGDVGLADVTVVLYDTRTNVVRSATTDTNGHYLLTGVLAGAYLVGVDTNTMPAGLAVGPLGAVGTDNNSQRQLYAVSLPSGSTNLTADFGYVHAGALRLAGTVFRDCVADKAYGRGDQPLAGLTLRLYRDSDTNGLLDGADLLVGAADSGADGGYAFTNLAAGSYLVDLVDNAGQLAGLVQSVGSNPQPVALNADNTSVDFGFAYAQPIGEISGYVWIDDNGNLLRDENLSLFGVNNARISLLAESPPGSGTYASIADTNTVTGAGGARGYYQFTGLASGSYRVVVDPDTVSAIPCALLPESGITNVVEICGVSSVSDVNFAFTEKTNIVEVHIFTACRVPGGVDVQWRTGPEMLNFGFNLYRSTSLTGAHVRVNASLIPGAGIGVGRTYQLIDTNAPANRAYFYWLEEVYWNSSVASYGPARVAASSVNDYDGDGVSDLAVFHEAAGVWYVLSERTGASLAWAQAWGFPGCVAAPGDYDGDGKSDLAVYHEATGQWYIYSPAKDAVLAWGKAWGFAGCVPVPADYDGDGVTDLAVYHEATGQWYVYSLARNAVLAWGKGWGFAGCVPAPADYDGDGAADLAVYHEAAGQWYIYSLAKDAILEWGKAWGFAGCVPVPGDYDGDGIADLAVYHEAAGQWYIYSPAKNAVLTWGLTWGFPGLVPVPGDYDGDGVSDLAVYHQAAGQWYILSIFRSAILDWGRNWGWWDADAVGGRY